MPFKKFVKLIHRNYLYKVLLKNGFRDNNIVNNNMTIHEQLLEQIEIYHCESQKFEDKFNKAAGTRARKALNEITKICKVRRKEIQDKKNEATV
jgi:hypothetical protein